MIVMNKIIKNTKIFLLSFCVKFLLTKGFFYLFNVNFLLTNTVFGAFTGGQPAQFLQYGAGARSFSMGAAFYSVSDDASATYWNPAGLSQLTRKEITALHIELFPGTDTRYDFISFVYPTPKLGVFGANIIRLFSGGFEKVNIQIDPKQGIIDIKTLDKFDDIQTAFTAAYGKKVLENISIGVATKFIQRSLDNIKDFIFTFDAALLMQGINPKFPNLNIGFGIKNLLTQSFDTEDKLPLIVRFGISNRFLKDKLLLSFDLEKNLKAQPTWCVGTEYNIVNFLALRLGFTGETGFRESNAGFGIKYKDYLVDYAFAIHDMGFLHRISGTWKFGRDITQNREALIRKYLKEAETSYQRGNFLIAYEKFDGAYSIDPTDKKIAKMMSRIKEVIGFIPKASADTEEETSIRKGVASYIEDDITGAINAFRYAYYKNPQNLRLLQLLNRLEQANNMEITEQYKEKIGGFTIIDKKIYDARQAVIEGKYDQAIIRCQEILNLEPNNTTALEIMGSAFFMMNQPDRARDVWEKVLEIDPSNKVVREFLEELK